MFRGICLGAMTDILQLERLMELVLAFSMLSFRCGRQKQVYACVMLYVNCIDLTLGPGTYFSRPVHCHRIHPEHLRRGRRLLDGIVRHPFPSQDENAYIH